MPKNDILLLDTYVWIWLLNGSKRLKGTQALAAINKASKGSGLWISAISVWEVAMLESKGRLILAIDIHSWIEQALQAPGIALAHLTPDIAIDSANLPGTFHGDPADRILVATARHFECPIVTADTSIHKYSNSGNVSIVKV